MYFNPVRAYNPYFQSKNVNPAKTNPSFGNTQKIHTLKEILDDVNKLNLKDKSRKEAILDFIKSHKSSYANPLLLGLGQLKAAVLNEPDAKESVLKVLDKMLNSEIVKDKATGNFVKVTGQGFAKNIQKTIDSIK